MREPSTAFLTSGPQPVLPRVLPNARKPRDAIGAMDGSPIPVPGMDPSLQSQYYNYKQFFSVVLLAIVDNRGLFRWICAGAPGEREEKIDSNGAQ